MIKWAISLNGKGFCCNTRGWRSQVRAFPPLFSKLIHFFKQISKMVSVVYQMSRIQSFYTWKDENALTNSVPNGRIVTALVKRVIYASFANHRGHLHQKKISRDWLCYFWQTTGTIFVILSKRIQIHNIGLQKDQFYENKATFHIQ